ncbi:MAG: cryptochrome/photolyase family protein [Verrucomicrobiota bacterium]
MNSVSLIYPHQLFSDHPALDSSIPAFLIEDPLLFGTDQHQPLNVHKQRLVFHRASMKAFAAEMSRRGYKLQYIDCPKGSRSDSYNVLRSLLDSTVKEIRLANPHDFLLEKRVRRIANELGAELVLFDTPAFISSEELLEKHTGESRKRPFMANFYKDQRNQLGILMEGDEPTGGRWSFDEDNRKKVPAELELPSVPAARRNKYVGEALDYVEERFKRNLGSVDSFAWPTTHAAAKSWLDSFLEERFREFGPYEDAIHLEHRTLFHSVLSPAINVGLLTPQEVVDAAIGFSESNDIPLNSLEGFIRQIIGWREFMLGIYRYRGVEIRNGNYWGHDREIPKAFYDASTGIPPVDDAIRHALDYAWGHHIERLMVIGNFMLLCRFSPDAIYRWFMELYIDAYDWVMVPNVYGMSQFADGGTFTTKPYLSGSNYIRKMSSYKTGKWCEIWDGLYWSFIGDHEDFFQKNPRLSMMTRSWQRMDSQKKKAHRENARVFLESVGVE